MKSIYLFIFCAWITTVSYAQNDIVVCHTPATEKFAMFASNKDFNASHPLPGKYIHVSEEGGKMITLKCADGKDANGYLLMSKVKTDNWIFVFQEWWGLNDYIKRQSESLFKDLGNVNVLALDMYDGKVSAERETAAKYMQEFKQERGDIIVKGAIAYAGKNAKIGTIGWCFGGGQSLQAALTAGKQTVACVMYYGMPVEDIDKLKKLNSEVLGIFAIEDKYITPEVVAKFESNMKAAGKKAIIKNYNADHGFANPSNAKGYKEEASKDAYANTLEFFKGKLK
ncbi:dienelactone hydrolase family protein [Ohtaekwangia koreensis]|uniref:Carboxymethylenebutenolidase n=1 Tax=Ohtaekwangia koreensis TaxID=688867 RepID=A0A1T5LIQ5_9BACT|nr:dienelactone hydrolase family protein [Ohtaekwangia koreensis]SKC75860.1 carboxymethylenebutenolidase [Ohtaekwangia koreensis]